MSNHNRKKRRLQTNAIAGISVWESPQCWAYALCLQTLVMIARITKALLLLQFIAILAIAALAETVFQVSSHAYALLSGLVAVWLLRLLITMNNFSLALQ